MRKYGENETLSGFSDYLFAGNYNTTMSYANLATLRRQICLRKLTSGRTVANEQGNLIGTNSLLNLQPLMRRAMLIPTQITNNFFIRIDIRQEQQSQQSYASHAHSQRHALSQFLQIFQQTTIIATIVRYQSAEEIEAQEVILSQSHICAISGKYQSLILNCTQLDYNHLSPRRIKNVERVNKVLLLGILRGKDVEKMIDQIKEELIRIGDKIMKRIEIKEHKDLGNVKQMKIREEEAKEEADVEETTLELIMQLRYIIMIITSSVQFHVLQLNQFRQLPQIQLHLIQFKAKLEFQLRNQQELLIH
ncbi:MAG: hypothetical protein EZS28_035276 [Streblomastix strix]|uniref:Uncharacterized protein n=1 Tax=Streblomastix strix TaxID=222440 RepID=A0A5J4UEY4_9EUKA|nr:MAG: hypothetical protein EZS28_035276 [Streblomastix strix]